MKDSDEMVDFFDQSIMTAVLSNKTIFEHLRGNLPQLENIYLHLTSFDAENRVQNSQKSAIHWRRIIATVSKKTL